MSAYTYNGYYGLFKIIHGISENIALSVECEKDKFLFAVVGEDNNTLFTTTDKMPVKCCDKVIDFLKKKYSRDLTR